MTASSLNTKSVNHIHRMHPFHINTGDKWDVVCVDVDSKDPRTGVSGPPPEFISERFLSDVKRILLPSG